MRSSRIFFAFTTDPKPPWPSSSSSTKSARYRDVVCRNFAIGLSSACYHSISTKILLVDKYLGVSCLWSHRNRMRGRWAPWKMPLVGGTDVSYKRVLEQLLNCCPFSLSSACQRSLTQAAPKEVLGVSGKKARNGWRMKA
jgi:hypothetical protein